MYHAKWKKVEENKQQGKEKTKLIAFYTQTKQKGREMAAMLLFYKLFFQLADILFLFWYGTKTG